MEPRLIASEFNRVIEINNIIDPGLFFSNRHKEDREWMILGAACKVLSKVQRQPRFIPHYAIKSERPDFLLFDETMESVGGLEVVEVVRPDELRHKKFKSLNADHDKKATSIYPMTGDPWLGLREAIIKKAEKRYPKDTILLVYFDIWRFAFQSWDRPVLEMMVEEFRKNPFESVEAFNEVLILDSGMNGLMQIHPPTFHTWKSDSIGKALPSNMIATQSG